MWVKWEKGMKKLRQCFMGMPPGNAIPSGDIIGYHLIVTLGQDIMGTFLLHHQTPAPSIILDG